MSSFSSFQASLPAVKHLSSVPALAAGCTEEYCVLVWLFWNIKYKKREQNKKHTAVYIEEDFDSRDDS